MILDSNGEVVLFNDSGFSSLELVAESAIVEQGLVDRHVTAGGDEVSGFRFITFASGLTLYYDPNLHVVVSHAEA